jgi:hypothetical protein
MSKFDTAINHGDLKVRIRHGGPGFSGLIQAGLLAGAAIGAAAVIIQFAWLIITLGAAAAALRLWLLHRRNLTLAAIAARGELIRAEQRALAAARVAEQRAHEIAVAEAGRPVIQNVIHPDALAAAFAAAAAGAQPQPVTIRGEVEQ